MVNYEQMPGVCQLSLQAPQPDLILSLEILRQDNFDNFTYVKTKIHSKSCIPTPFFYFLYSQYFLLQTSEIEAAEIILSHFYEKFLLSTF